MKESGVRTCNASSPTSLGSRALRHTGVRCCERTKRIECTENRSFPNGAGGGAKCLFLPYFLRLGKRVFRTPGPISTEFGQLKSLQNGGKTFDYLDFPLIPARNWLDSGSFSATYRHCSTRKNQPRSGKNQLPWTSARPSAGRFFASSSRPLLAPEPRPGGKLSAAGPVTSRWPSRCGCQRLPAP